MIYAATIIIAVPRTLIIDLGSNQKAQPLFLLSFIVWDYSKCWRFRQNERIR